MNHTSDLSGGQSIDLLDHSLKQTDSGNLQLVCPHQEELEYLRFIFRHFDCTHPWGIEVMNDDYVKGVGKELPEGY